MFNRQTPVQLSFQDRFILAFDRMDLPFNSHLIIDLESAPNNSKLKQTLVKLYELESYCRIVPDIETGKFYLQPFDEIKAALHFKEMPLSEESSLWSKAFNFDSDYGVKLYYLHDDSSHRLVFTFHHSLYDGHAQFNFLKDFLDIYSGENYSPRELKDIYRFRKYFIETKFKWFLNLFKDKFTHKKKAKHKVKIARLFDQETESRVVEARTFELDRSIFDKDSRKLGLSMSAYISLLGAKAMDATLRDRGLNDQPIVLFITKSMRFELKALRALQNLVGFIWMKIEREEINNPEYVKKFKDTYKFRSSEDEVRKTLIGAALMTRLLNFKKLQIALIKKEKKVHDCTLIVSSGRTPPELKFPEEIKVKSIIARGTMHRSPGIGLMVTGYKSKDFVTVEYLKEAINKETIDQFCSHLNRLINSGIN